MNRPWDGFESSAKSKLNNAVVRLLMAALPSAGFYRLSLWGCLLPILMGSSAHGQKPVQSGVAALRPSLTGNQPAEGGNDASAKELGGGMKTLGGRQFWGDLTYFHGWRIQQHVLTGHCRLLDPRDRRFESGTLQECQSKLKSVKEQLKLPPMQGEVVVLVHGIIRSSKSFFRMDDALRDAGYAVVPFDYPSTRVTIQQSADYLKSTIKSLEGVSRIHFVVHSMGGLVVRAAMKGELDQRLGRMVMLGVPNHGAVMADKLKSNPLFKLVMGPAGQQLISDPEGLIAKLPTPPFEFAVIAGARGTLAGYNPLVAGDDDGTVSVLSTRLPGARDFGTVNCLHSFLMNDRDAIRMTVAFLKSGCLHENGQCRPIPAEQAGEARVD